MIYGASAPVIFLAFRETRGAVILSKRARKTHRLPDELSRTTSTPTTTIKEFVYGNIIRPFRLLFTEPVVFVFTLLSALSYGVVFMSTLSVGQVYATNYGWKDHQSGLVQASIVLGEFAGLLTCLIQNQIFSRAAAAHSAQPNTRLPEVRLYLSIPASFIGLAGGMFWYGWTSYSFLPWILPSVALGLIGFGTMVVMQAIMMYITDAYAKYAGSASAAVCFGENVFAAFLPLATISMYTNLGFRWASSLLGFVALVLSFAPVMLVLKGKAIRRSSPFMSEAIFE